MSSSNTSKTSSKGALTMADLMKSVTTNFVSPHKGDILDAVITKLTSAEILVDIGAKTHAVVLEKDKRILRSLLTSLKVGDKVKVSVLNPESDLGSPVVSLRRFNDDRNWERLESLLKNKEKLKATIDEITKGGFLVSTKDGIAGFLPNSQTSFLDNTQNAVGKALEVCVIELSRPLRKVIFSQKATFNSKDFEKAAKSLKKGQVLEAEISNIAPFGIFALINVSDNQKVEGFVHISEISWERMAVVSENFKQGDKFQAEVLGLDNEAKRVNLSIKRLTKNPFEEKLKSFVADKKVEGIISKVASIGVFVDLGEGIEGFIKKEKIPPTVSFVQGAKIEATIVEVDKKQRVILAPILKEKPIGYR